MHPLLLLWSEGHLYRVCASGFTIMCKKGRGDLSGWHFSRCLVITVTLIANTRTTSNANETCISPKAYIFSSILISYAKIATVNWTRGKR